VESLSWNHIPCQGVPTCAISRRLQGLVTCTVHERCTNCASGESELSIETSYQAAAGYTRHFASMHFNKSNPSKRGPSYSQRRKSNPTSIQKRNRSSRRILARIQKNRERRSSKRSRSICSTKRSKHTVRQR
jgi:hypothetical protein